MITGRHEDSIWIYHRMETTSSMGMKQKDCMFFCLSFNKKTFKFLRAHLRRMHISSILKPANNIYLLYDDLNYVKRYAWLTVYVLSVYGTWLGNSAWGNHENSRRRREDFCFFQAEMLVSGRQSARVYPDESDGKNGANDRLEPFKFGLRPNFLPSGKKCWGGGGPPPPPPPGRAAPVCLPSF